MRTNLGSVKQATADEIGRLIGRALTELNAQRPRHERLSQRAAATLAGIHESWWRAVVAGGQQRGDTWVPVKAAPETYIDMAAVVGVEDEVRKLLGEEAPAAGFDPVDLSSQMSSSDAIVPDTAEAIRNDPLLIDEAKQHLLNQYELLLRLPPAAARTRVEKTARRATTLPDASPGLRAVARGGDPKDRTEVRRIAREARRQHEQDTGKEQ